MMIPPEWFHASFTVRQKASFASYLYDVSKGFLLATVGGSLAEKLSLDGVLIMLIGAS